MRTHLTSSLPQKRPMIVFPIALAMIVLCGVATMLAPQPGRQVHRFGGYESVEKATAVSTTDAPLARADVSSPR